MNALKSGAHSKTRVLPFEDPKAYDDIARAVYDEVEPNGILETTLVDQIVHDLVILRRLESSESAHLIGRAQFFAQERVVQLERFSHGRTFLDRTLNGF